MWMQRWVAVAKKHAGQALLTTVLLVGQASAAEIVVAHIAPFTGRAASDARDLNVGMKAHFSRLNAQGGVAGQAVRLLSFDDRYEGPEFARQLDEAVRQRAVAVLCPLGISAMRTMLDDALLDKHDTVVINAIPGATVFRSPGHPRLFHVRASDRQQIEKIFRLAQTLSTKRIQVVIQDKKAGEADVEAARAKVPDGGSLQITIREVELQPGALALAATDLAKTSFDAVLVLGSPPYMAEAIHELRKAGVSQMVYTLSYVPAGLVVKLAGAAGSRGVGIAQTYPSPTALTMPLHREFHNAMKAIAPEITAYSSFHLEGYVSARVLTEALKRTKIPATARSIATTLRTMGAINIGGFLVDFSKGNAGSSYVDIAAISRTGQLSY